MQALSVRDYNTPYFLVSMYLKINIKLQGL